MYKEYDKKTLENLHKVELEILDEFVRICNKHNLEYYLIGGTMLGAIRHKGFIPWDDDIDVGMMRKDYDLFIKYAKKELKKQYYLDCFETNKDYYFPFAKIKKNNTIFNEQANAHLKNHKGIYIDIVPIDNAKKQDSLFQKTQAVLVRNITETMLCKKKINKIKNSRYPFLSLVFSIFPCTTLMKIQAKLIRLNKNHNSEYVVLLAGVYGYKKETNKREVFTPSVKVKFENKEYNGVADANTYLTKIYGDYMKLPPKEKRLNHMPLEIVFDTNKEK